MKNSVCKQCPGVAFKCDRCGRGMCKHLKGKRPDGDVCGPCMLKEAREKKAGK